MLSNVRHVFHKCLFYTDYRNVMGAVYFYIFLVTLVKNNKIEKLLDYLAFVDFQKQTLE